MVDSITGEGPEKRGITAQRVQTHAHTIGGSVRRCHSLCLWTRVYRLPPLASSQTLQPCVVMLCLSACRQNIHSLLDYVCATGHVCLMHVCVDPYVWSILVIPIQLIRLLDGHPSIFQPYVMRPLGAIGTNALIVPLCQK